MHYYTPHFIMSNELEPTPESQTDKILAIKNEMIQALEKDLILNKSKQPALNRLKLLNSISIQLLNKNLQKELLEFNILEIIKEWLEPMPDGTLPNIKIRKTLIEVLLNLPASKGQLINSNGIGKIVNFYYKNSDENGEVRSMAGELVKKWRNIIVAREEDEWIS